MLLCYPGTRRDMVEKTRKQLHGGVEKKVIFHEVSVPVGACIKLELNQPPHQGLLGFQHGGGSGLWKPRRLWGRGWS